jgi:2'-5' RNA ligase
MPKQFFSIPLAGNPDLVALQDYLKTKLPADAAVVWQDPATFHITLVVADEVTEDISGLATPTNLPAFGLGGDLIGSWSTPDGYAVTLKIQNAPQLTYIQAAIFYELRARGIVTSPFSWPGIYRPHITLATSQVEMYPSVPQMVHLVVDRFVISGEDYAEIKSYPLLAVPNGGQIQEMVHLQDTMVVWELRGSYPDVAIAKDVDYKLLTQGDDDPMFVTLPIGKAGVTSGNHLHYDEDFVQELERQALENKPVGLMGHLRDEDRSTEFPTEAVHWVGVQRVGELLWGKGYVPPGEARDRIRRYKAQGKEIATSIDAYMDRVWDKTINAYRAIGSTLKLNQIDIAPADRAGIPDLASIPNLTTEMVDTTNKQATKEQEDMDKLQIIQEMTAEDARLLPDVVKTAIKAEVPVPAEVKLVQEMRSALGLAEDADLVAAVKALADDKAKREAETVTARVKELVQDTEKGVKVESARGVVTELVMARKPSTIADAEKAFGEVVESDAVKGLLRETVTHSMGPAQNVSVASRQGKAKYFSIPDTSKAS